MLVWTKPLPSLKSSPGYIQDRGDYFKISDYYQIKRFRKVFIPYNRNNYKFIKVSWYKQRKKMNGIKIIKQAFEIMALVTNKEIFWNCFKSNNSCLT